MLVKKRLVFSNRTPIFFLIIRSVFRIGGILDKTWFGDVFVILARNLHVFIAYQYL